MSQAATLLRTDAAAIADSWRDLAMGQNPNSWDQDNLNRAASKILAMDNTKLAGLNAETLSLLIGAAAFHSDRETRIHVINKIMAIAPDYEVLQDALDRQMEKLRDRGELLFEALLSGANQTLKRDEYTPTQTQANPGTVNYAAHQAGRTLDIAAAYRTAEEIARLNPIVIATQPVDWVLDQFTAIGKIGYDADPLTDQAVSKIYMNRSDLVDGMVPLHQQRLTDLRTQLLSPSQRPFLVSLLEVNRDWQNLPPEHKLNVIQAMTDQISTAYQHGRLECRFANIPNTATYMKAEKGARNSQGAEIVGTIDYGQNSINNNFLEFLNNAGHESAHGAQTALAERRIGHELDAQTRQMLDFSRSFAGNTNRKTHGAPPAEYYAHPMEMDAVNQGRRVTASFVACIYAVTEYAAGRVQEADLTRLAEKSYRELSALAGSDKATERSAPLSPAFVAKANQILSLNR